MTRVLIPTYRDDIHATVVGLALERLGHRALLWHGADFPTRQAATMTVSVEEEMRWEVRGEDLALAGDEPVDVVWNRRPSQPVLPADLPIPEGDRYVARREAVAFDRALWPLVAPDAFWINPPAGRARANLKPWQLARARDVGLAIPPTLFSNDPERIRAFLARWPGETVYKPFVPTHWDRGEEGIAFFFTSPVGPDDLPEDEILRLSPGIFQRRVAKACELRVTYMGEHAVCARLLSQRRESSREDWRNAFAGLDVEPAELPEEVDARCRRLMHELGIVFGCIDLIVTPAGEHVFLEVNEMGQFLWLDELCPEINTLAPFCQFLIQGRSDFSWRASAGDPRFLELRDEALRVQREVDAVRHVERPLYHLAPDGAGVEVATPSSRPPSDPFR